MSLSVQPIARNLAPATEKTEVTALVTSDSNLNFVHDPDEFSDLDRLRSLTLASFDILGVLVAAVLGLTTSVLMREAFSASQPASIVNTQSLLAAIAIPALVLLIASYNFGHYSRIKPFWTEAAEIVKAVFYGSALAVVFVFVTKTDVSRIWLISGGMFLLFFSPMMRAAGKTFLAGCNRWYSPLVIAGDRTLIAECRDALESDLTIGYRVAVEVNATNLVDPSDERGVIELAKTLRDVARLYQKPRLLLAFDFRDPNEMRQILMESLQDDYEHIVVAKQMYGVPALNTEVVQLDKYDTLFFRFQKGGISKYKRTMKRSIDILGASIALTLLSPVLLVLGLIVRSDGGKAFYGSERIGQNGRRFKCLKFRSMSENSEAILRDHLDADEAAREEWFNSFKLTNDPRITDIGRFIRRTSLDELPQFYNVLRGDMSLVGPRPILPDEAATYGKTISLYQGVRPGITGLWQISGRSDLEYQERINLNKWYVRNWSIWLDFSILVRTIPAVLGSSGAK